MENTQLVKLINDIADNIDILQEKIVEQQTIIDSLQSENKHLKAKYRDISQKINSYLTELETIREYYADSQNKNS